MEWLFLLIPIIGAGIAKIKFDRRLDAMKLALPFGVCIITILIGKYCAESLTARSTEYLGGYLVNTGYYEPWDEKVSCRHTKYCTRTVYDGKGRSHTESYACGTEHMYDVDYHPEYWEVVDSNGYRWHVPKADFDTLCAEWKSRFFVAMYRHYHSINGDKYQGNWDQSYERLHPTVVEHSYENRIACSDSVLNCRDVPVEEKKQYSLFEYPRTNYFYTCVLGYNHPGNVDLDKTNALIGRNKQVRIWLLCFHNQPLQAAVSQETYWKHGNKNELVICTSVDKENKIQWAHVFSWTEKEDLKIRVREWLQDRQGKILDVKVFNDFLKPQIEKDWKRREFAEFSYLEIKPPMWAYGLIGFAVIATTVIVFVLELKEN